MGLINAAIGAIGGSLADQRTDFLTIPLSIEPTVALFPSVRNGTNAGRGSNVQVSQAVVTNGSKIVVPEGYGLILLQDGEITGLATEPGGYVWDSDNPESQSMLVYDGTTANLAGDFNRGGDTLAISGRASSFTIQRVGSNAVLASQAGQITVRVPAGVTGSRLVFENQLGQLPATPSSRRPR